VDGIALHAYTHGADSNLVFSDEVNAEHGWRWHFRTYQDFMHAIPAGMSRLPVYITETNQGDDAWANVNAQWVQAMYAEVNNWNQVAGNQKIHCACLYRWEEYDRWGFRRNQAVLDDLKAAALQGYTVPMQVISGDGLQTPADLMSALQNRFGTFDLDACASDGNAKARFYFTEESDGLARGWGGYGLCFVNPPYRQTVRWLQKAIVEVESGVTTVCVVRADTGTNWWHDLAMQGSIYLLRGRVTFDAPPGVEDKRRPGHATAIVVYGPGWPNGVIQAWDWRKDIEG
jgi:phage N-6-adenine-methyltransferase